MKNLKKFIIRFPIVALLLSIMMGCSARGPIFQPMPVKAELATVYVYRVPKTVGSGNVFTVIINGKPVANLENGGYFPHYATQGNLEFVAVNKLRPPYLDSLMSQIALRKKIQLKISATSSKIYYVKLTHGYGSVTMEQVSDEVGKQEISQLRLSELISVER